MEMLAFCNQTRAALARMRLLPTVLLTWSIFKASEAIRDWISAINIGGIKEENASCNVNPRQTVMSTRYNTSFPPTRITQSRRFSNANRKYLNPFASARKCEGIKSFTCSADIVKFRKASTTRVKALCRAQSVGRAHSPTAVHIIWNTPPEYE